MPEPLPRPETKTSAGQQWYEWLAVRGRKPHTWPAWEQLTPEQRAILEVWAEKLRATVEVPCSTS
jgi:hypothetical protein